MPKYLNINDKSLENNSVVFYLYQTVYSLLTYLLTFLINNSGDGNCFYRAVVIRRDETGDETRRSVGGVTVCSRKIQRFLSCHSSLFSVTKTVTVSSTLKFSTMISSADLTD